MLPLTISVVLLSVFFIATLLLAYFCRYQLKNTECHGFYRFFAFVGIIWLLLQALPWWHYQLISLRQCIALLFFAISLGLLIASVKQLHTRGHANKGERRDARENFQFENTQVLVTSGVYQYIRHPMYSSLLFLSLGLLCKRPAIDSLLVALFIAAMLYLTVRKEEQENKLFFGEQYDVYVSRSKLLIPSIW